MSHLLREKARNKRKIRTLNICILLNSLYDLLFSPMPIYLFNTLIYDANFQCNIYSNKINVCNRDRIKMRRN